MASWNDVKSHLTAQGIPFDEPSPTQLRISFAYDDGRTQRIVATQQTLRGELWCELTSALDSASLDVVQQLVTRALVGGIYVTGGACVLRSVLSLPFLTGPAFEHHARRQAGEADELEANMSRTDRF